MSQSTRRIFINELSQRLGKTVSTIHHYAGNEEHHHRLPPWRKNKFSRFLYWLEEDVIAFEKEAQVASAQIETRPRGRPTKAAQIARDHEAPGH